MPATTGIGVENESVPRSTRYTKSGRIPTAVMLKSAATQASTTALFEAARFSVTTSSQSKRVLALDRAPGSAVLATGPLAADAGDESLAEAALADRRNRDEPLRFGQPDMVGVESAAARRDVGGP